MKKRMFLGVVLALMLSLVFAGTAFAVSQSTIDNVIADAKDGHLDGTWTSAQVAAALDWLQNSSLNTQYGDQEAVLASYSGGAEGSEPGVAAASGGSLAFTGINVLIALGAGAGLIGGGLALRHRR